MSKNSYESSWDDELPPSLPSRTRSPLAFSNSGYTPDEFEQRVSVTLHNLDNRSWPYDSLKDRKSQSDSTKPQTRMAFATGWAKKFTDTLSETIDSVKTYGSNVQGSKLAIPVPGLKQANGTTPTDGRPGDLPRSPSASANRSFFGLPNRNLLTEGSPIKALTSPIKSPVVQDKVEKSPVKEPLIDSSDGFGFESEFGRERSLSNASQTREVNGDAHDHGYHNAKIDEEPELDLFDLEEFGVPMQSYVSEKKMSNTQGGELDPSSTTMVTHRVPTEEDEPEKHENKCLGAIKRFLQDNRYPDGDGDDILMQSTEGNEMLKRVLNIMFLAIGVSLFVAVVVVVIYAVVVEQNTRSQE